MDITAAQALIDVRNQLTRYAAPHAVEWRFANIQNRWTKRALASAGFGYRSPEATAIGGSASIFSIADLGEPETQVDRKTAVPHDIEEGEIKQDNDVSKTPSEIRLVTVHGLNRPYFHVDLQEALEAAIESVDGRETKAWPRLLFRRRSHTLLVVGYRCPCHHHYYHLQSKTLTVICIFLPSLLRHSELNQHYRQNLYFS